MIGLTDAARRIVAVAAPILCIDTSSLLDLARDPLRPKFDARHAGAALQLIARAESKPATLTIVLTEQVIKELNDHLSEVKAEGERAIQQLNKALEICRIYGAIHGLPTPVIPTSAYSSAADAVIQRFVRTAVTLRGSAASRNRAWDRVSTALAPAKRGKQSMKDCVIIENYLQVIGKVRTNGFQRKALFLTSNTADYAEGPSFRLHPDLVSSFSSVSLGFQINFESALWST